MRLEDIIRNALQRPGPVLFNIFIHDLDNSMESVRFKDRVSILNSCKILGKNDYKIFLNSISQYLTNTNWKIHCTGNTSEVFTS